MQNNSEWSSFPPTKENDGQWFFVKVGEIIKFKKVRVGVHNRIYLCPESDFGMNKDTLGIPLDFYAPGIKFIGPVSVPTE